MRQGRPLLAFSLGCALVVCVGVLTASDARAADDEHPVVILDTSAGAITIELDRAKAPITVANFLKYVDSGYYNGLVFHRVMPTFMIQGGGMEDRGTQLRERLDGQLDPIKNEAGNGLSNARGTLAMARTNDPNSATSQFFINVVDNSDRLDRTAGSAGYAVFGKVIEGMDVVDAIKQVKTQKKRDGAGTLHDDVPSSAVTIRSAKRKNKS
jgi:peptidyl-prolyl cis-trans isomerase A (cyclophilin A)